VEKPDLSAIQRTMINDFYVSYVPSQNESLDSPTVILKPVTMMESNEIVNDMLRSFNTALFITAFLVSSLK
jgi:hypothetical protein